MKLFGRVLAADGPKAGTYAAGHDDGIKRIIAHKLGSLLGNKDTDFFKISDFGKRLSFGGKVIFEIFLFFA
jgi:hypothetical protein